MGGLPRRATFIRNEAKDGIPTLMLEAGGFAANRPMGGAELDTAVRKGEVVVRGLARMGYRAIALGENDLYLGRENLEKLMKAAGRIAFLCANLKDKNGKPFYRASAVFETGGVRVGVLGLTSREVYSEILSRRFPGAWVDDPVKTASEEVPRLRQKCDLVVALTHLGLGADRTLAERVPGIDIIIGGRSNSWLTPPPVVNGTLVCNGYFEGRAVGRLVLAGLPRKGSWMPGKQADQALAQEAQVKDGLFPTLSAAERAEVERRAAEARAGDRFDGALIDMTDAIPDDPEMVALVAGYRKTLAKEAARAARTTPPIPDQENPEHYSGSAMCRDCHRARVLFWQKTSHARAFSTLLGRGSEGDPDCMPCHTTGFLRPTGYAPASPRAYLRGVQCESCHGMGSLHEDDPSGRRLRDIPPPSVCLECHIRGRDDHFDYGKSRKAVCGETP